MGSVSISSKSFEGRYFKFTVSQSGTSTSVNWTFEVLGGSSLYYTASPITLKINGTTVYSISSITYWDSYTFPAAKGSKTGTYNIGSYGSFTVSLSGNPNWHAAETVSGTVTLDRPTYPVYYNTMGGSGTFNAQTKTYGINLQLHTHKPTKTGYTFQGWATSEGSTTVAYAAGATYTGNARLDLFAVWKADTYAVTYNANGGSGAPANQTKTYGVTLKLQTGVPTRTNYNFLGWGTSASATTVAYAPGANYTGNSKLDLYAIWELAYVKPRITNLLVDRCDSGGTSTEDGTYAVVAFNWATDRDVTSVKIEWKLASETSYPSGNSKTVSASGTSGTVNTVVGSGAISADNTYTLKVTVADSIDNSNETRTLSSMEFTLDLLAGGKGAAFGKAAETENLLEVDWKLKVNDDITTDGGLIVGSDITTGGHLLVDKDLVVGGTIYPKELLPGDDLNKIIAPGNYVCNYSSYAAQLLNCPTSVAFTLEVLQTNPEGCVQRLTSYLTDSSYVYTRRIYQGTISEWQVSPTKVVYNRHNLYYTSSTSWFYTGASITIPKYSIFGICAEAIYSYSRPTGTAIASSSTNFNNSYVISSDFGTYGTGVSWTGYTGGSNMTYYIWAKYLSAASNYVDYSYWYMPF